jgi:1-deoxy-D-xylulose-5-phosphate reductoisomerase
MREAAAGTVQSAASSAATAAAAEDSRVRVALLGSTGSIGRQALDVVRRNPALLRVVALGAYRSIETLVAQAVEFGVRAVAIGDEELRDHPLLAQLPRDVTVSFGAAGLEALCTCEDVDVVLNALVGVAGLRASYTTLKQGRRLALANKESLVVGGDLIMPLADPCVGTLFAPPAAAPLASPAAAPSPAASAGRPLLVPVDSEHSAIFQCLVGESSAEVSHLWLTASGGPFRGMAREQLAHITAAEALAHPTWLMGPKISIDSATLMNKGLEIIEAHHLFSLDYDDIRVVVHPQSCIHSMVAYRDGSVKAHLGVTDMRIPIQYALSYPQRWETSLEPLDFTRLGQLTFEEPDLKTFGALRLALAAGRAGGSAPAVLNAANEVAVQAFLEGACAFLDIERAVGTVLERHDPEPVRSLDQLEAIDARARHQAQEFLRR